MFFLSSTKIFEATKTNRVDPDQTAPVGAVWSGSTMFASMLMLNRHFQMQLFCWRFKDLTPQTKYIYLSKKETQQVEI